MGHAGLLLKAPRIAHSLSGLFREFYLSAWPGRARLGQVRRGKARFGVLRRARDRWQRTGKWGLDGPAMQEIRDAISVYEEVLLASSPMQMHEADGTRVKWIRLQKKGHKNGIV